MCLLFFKFYHHVVDSNLLCFNGERPKDFRLFNNITLLNLQSTINNLIDYNETRTNIFIHQSTMMMMVMNRQ